MIDFDQIDKTIHEKARLSIMTLLASRGEWAFQDLKAELGMSDGNLISHLRTLATCAALAGDYGMGSGVDIVVASLCKGLGEVDHCPSHRGWVPFALEVQRLLEAFLPFLPGTAGQCQYPSSGIPEVAPD